VAAEAANPKGDTASSREGTAAHWVWHEVLRGAAPTCRSLIGHRAPNGVVIDERAAQGAQCFVDEIRAVVPADRLHEVQLEAPLLHHGVHTENGGTPDAFWVDTAAHTLYVWDYKHGYREVTPLSHQIVNYALMALPNRSRVNYPYDDEWLQALNVSLRVVQPFCYHKQGGVVEEWRGTAADLAPVWKKLRMKAKQADELPLFTPGQHCRDCSAVGKCPAVRKLTNMLHDMTEKAGPLDEMAPAEMAVELRHLEKLAPVLKDRIEALEASLIDAVQRGDVSAGLVLANVPGRGDDWTAPFEQVVALTSMFGVEATKPVLKTPKQVIDSAPAELRPALRVTLAQVSQKKPGSVQLRPADETIAALTFSKRT
jgi:hypothetical protein